MTQLNRRQFLARASAGAAMMLLPTLAQASGVLHTLEGDVYINQRKASLNSKIKAGDHIVVAHDGKLVFSLGGDAFMLHGGTVLVLEHAKQGLITGLRLITGALLAVFAKRQHHTKLRSHVATIGIRGTAVFMHSSPNKLYTCTCYGHTDIQVEHHKDEIKATHHNAHEVSVDAHGIMQMRATQVLDHSDDELRMLESIVGRVVPFD
jgi:hypothetical protein